MENKKILFPFRASANNKLAFVHAVETARKENASLVLLTTFWVDPIKGQNILNYRKNVNKEWNNVFWKVDEWKQYYLENYTQYQKVIGIPFAYEFRVGEIIPEYKRQLKDKGIYKAIIPTNFNQSIPQGFTQKEVAKLLKATSCEVEVFPQQVESRQLPVSA